MVEKKPISKQKNTPNKPIQPETSNIINFYSRTKVYSEFSNFHRAPFNLDSKEWPTVEHYFQAQKCLDETVQEKVRALKSPKDVKSMGRKMLLRDDWEKVKFELMEKALKAKFEQNVSLKKLLLGTEQKELREHTSRDNLWGDGGNGKGKNMLGIILMKVRDDLRKADSEEKKD